MIKFPTVHSFRFVALLIAGLAPAAQAATLERVQSGLTYQRADGNRFIHGHGALHKGEPIDIALGEPARWVVGVQAGHGSLWVAGVESGALHAVALRDGKAERILNFEPARLEGPPVLIRLGRRISVLAPAAQGSPMSHPVPIARQQRVAFVSDRGLLSLASFYGSQRSGVNIRIPLDTRILADDQGRLLTLSDPTTRYAHGALGDGVEAASMTLLDAGGKVQVRQRIEFAEPAVFEGIAPLWVDWNRDGQREIVATLSDPGAGARIVLFSETGERIAESAPVGAANRWRHAIAVAPFGPGGEMELAEVVTPHLGSRVQFLAWRGKSLEPTATIGGFTSHVSGSRNLDMAAAGDFDGDGRVELLLPATGLDSLGGIRRTAKGAEVAWKLRLPAPLSSNIGSVVMDNRSMVVAAGLADGTLRFWGAR